MPEQIYAESGIGYAQIMYGWGQVAAAFDKFPATGLSKNRMYSIFKRPLQEFIFSAPPTPTWRAGTTASYAFFRPPATRALSVRTHA